MRRFYRGLFQYDNWATRRLIEVIEREGIFDARILELVAHTVVARKLWLARIRGEDTSAIPIWPQLSLDGCRSLLAEEEEDFDRLLEEVDHNGDQRCVSYRNSSGQDCENSIAEILLHMSHHAAYHRGQISNRMRAIGLEPVNTDYIVYARGIRPQPVT